MHNDDKVKKCGVENIAVIYVNQVSNTQLNHMMSKVPKKVK